MKKILIIGLGSIAKKHIRVLNEFHPDFQIFALRSNKQSIPVPGVHDIYSWDTIDFNPDFIIVSSPTSTHLEYVKKAITFNVPLFIEKPVFNSLDDIKSILESIKTNKIPTYIACNMRFHPCIEYLKEAILSKKYGKIEEVTVYAGSYLPSWRDSDYKTSYSAQVALGGGVHLDLIHELDYLYSFFGVPDKVISTLKSNSSLKIDAVDYAHYCLHYDDFVASVTLNYFRKKPKRTIELVTDQGVLNVDLMNNKIIFDDICVYENSSFDFLETYKKQMDYFLKSDLSMNTIEDGVKVLEICLSDEKIRE